jgi:hypothetical protein
MKQGRYAHILPFFFFFGADAQRLLQQLAYGNVFRILLNKGGVVKHVILSLVFILKHSFQKVNCA